MIAFGRNRLRPTAQHRTGSPGAETILQMLKERNSFVSITNEPLMAAHVEDTNVANGDD